jgi:hypothetical protein
MSILIMTPIVSLTTTSGNWHVGDKHVAVALKDTPKGSVIDSTVNAVVTRIESVWHDDCSPNSGCINRDFNVFGYVHRVGEERVLATINGSCVEAITYEVGGML